MARVRAVLYLNGLRGSDLEDAVQEVHLRALERGPEDAAARGAWAAAVATNLALDLHRRAATRRRMEPRLRVPEHVDPPDLALKAAVAEGLSRLEPDLRAVLVLRFYADLPVRDIAERLGIPEGTVKSRLHRAVGEMRGLLPPEEVR